MKEEFKELEEKFALIQALQELYDKMGGAKKKGTISEPKKFIAQARKRNSLFASLTQQDAHEFLNFLLNEAIDYFASIKKPEMKSIFQGTLVNETKCLCCERISKRHEDFIDLSVDVMPNTSITSCLNSFSSMELLANKDKFFCENCNCLQEAEKRMLVQKIPQILVLHLKRFKYIENVGRYVKISSSVPFPTTLRLFNTADDCEQKDVLYSLFSVIVHVGNGPNHGHYVSVCESGGQWILFDDDLVSAVDSSFLNAMFGAIGEVGGESAYILFYRECASSLVEK